MTQSDEWSANLARNIGKNLKSERQRWGLSAQKLSDRLKALGVDVPRDVIANIESGRRRTVSVAELIALGYALKVPPLFLIYPLARMSEEVETLPGTSELAVVAAMDFYGEYDVDGILDAPIDEPEIFGRIRAVYFDERKAAELLASADQYDRDMRSSEADRHDKEEAKSESIGDSFRQTAYALVRQSWRTRIELSEDGIDFWAVPKALSSLYARAKCEVVL